jgi:stage III sporulation protein AG
MENKKLDKQSLMAMIKSISIEKWLLIGGAGVVLILCSDLFGTGDKKETKNSSDVNSYVNVDDTDKYVSSLEDKLEHIISKLEGVGAVQVMVTVKNSSTKEVLKENDVTEKDLKESDSSGGVRESNEQSKNESVIYDEFDNSKKSPFVVSNFMPEVEGVAVIAEGGDSPVVKEKITGIIKALFGIEINKIAVGKMK